jgi:hypothetical protein
VSSEFIRIGWSSKLSSILSRKCFRTFRFTTQNIILFRRRVFFACTRRLIPARAPGFRRFWRIDTRCEQATGLPHGPSQVFPQFFNKALLSSAVTSITLLSRLRIKQQSV